jgi:hypothetical protein
MREMIMRRWCDVCFAEGQLQQEAAHTFTVGAVVGEARPALKVVETCDVHQKMVADLMELLNGIGQIPEFKKAALPAAPVLTHPAVECPICRMDVGRNTLVAHVWNKHRTDARPPTPKTCPECGERFDNGTGMSAHRRSIHDFDALADALGGVKGYRR